LCPDGLVFDETSSSFAKCSFPFSVDCTGRQDLQAAKSSPGCPRENGYFPHPDETICDVFHFCVDGHPNRIECPSGLIFDNLLGQCGWADKSLRKGCTSEDLFSFVCPKEFGTNEHSRHADPEDCAFFFLCVDGKARRNGCGQGLVFNEKSLSCERQHNLSGRCSNWYNETYLESIFPTQRKAQDFKPIQRRRRPSVKNNGDFSLNEHKIDFEDYPRQLHHLANDPQLGFTSKQRKPVTSRRKSIKRRPIKRPELKTRGGTLSEKRF